MKTAYRFLNEFVDFLRHKYPEASDAAIQIFLAGFICECMQIGVNSIGHGSDNPNDDKPKEGGK